MTTATRILIALSFLLAVSAPTYGTNHVGFTDIIIDPGPVGTTGTSLVVSVPDLIGLQFDGSPFAWNFVFSDMKHLEINAAAGYHVSLEIPLPPGTVTQEPTLDQAYFSDENGEPIPGITTSADAFTDFGVLAVYSLSTPFHTPISFSHHDIHMVGQLPNISGVVGNGLLQTPQIYFNLLTNEGDPGTLQVGEWGPELHAVPEPTTFTLSIVALTGLITTLCRRQRRRR